MALRSLASLNAPAVCSSTALTSKRVAAKSVAPMKTVAQPRINSLRSSFSVSPGVATLRAQRSGRMAAAAPRALATTPRASQLPVDLTGKRAFIAGVADDQGFGWAIAKVRVALVAADGPLLHVSLQSLQCTAPDPLSHLAFYEPSIASGDSVEFPECSCGLATLQREQGRRSLCRPCLRQVLR
mmetsp:Transcript_6421/g.23810  ORF Transcript_6421/g.23810 Transcript_6421/m.23810 type:complete len:184 (-) Transcript_6421:1087-1638(-)